MPDDDGNHDKDAPSPAAETFECPMCRQRAPATQSIVMGGRRLCFGCASGWFEDDEDGGGGE